MNEIEALRAELQDLHAGMRKALALLAHTTAAHSPNSAALLADLLENTRQAQTTKPSFAFDTLAQAMLLAVSSVALKQHPEDQQVSATYRGLRPGDRH